MFVRINPVGSLSDWFCSTVAIINEKGVWYVFNSAQSYLFFLYFAIIDEGSIYPRWAYAVFIYLSSFIHLTGCSPQHSANWQICGILAEKALIFWRKLRWFIPHTNRYSWCLHPLIASFGMISIEGLNLHPTSNLFCLRFHLVCCLWSFHCCSRSK